MKRIVQVVLVAAAVLLAYGRVEAQVYPLSFTLTLKEQLPSQFSEKTQTYTDRVRTSVITANTLLRLLEPFYTESFPSGFPRGARLCLVDYESFQVRSATGAVLVQTTAPYLTYSDTYSQTNFLYQGRENIATDALNHRYFYHSTLQFHDPAAEGYSFAITFNTVETYQRLRENRQGWHPAQGMISMSGFGSGWKGNSYIMLSGRGKSPLTGWYE